MSRPKKGTKAGELASKRWHESMIKKYGGEEGFKDSMRAMGRKGGSISRGGGFASNVVGEDGLTGRQRAKIAGAKGGSISRRGEASKTIDLLKTHHDKIVEMLDNGYSIKNISRATGIPILALSSRIDYQYTRRLLDDESI